MPVKHKVGDVRQWQFFKFPVRSEEEAEESEKGMVKAGWIPISTRHRIHVYKKADGKNKIQPPRRYRPEDDPTLSIGDQLAALEGRGKEIRHL